MLAICDYTYAHDFEVDNIYYKIISKADKTCKVTNNSGKENSYSGNVTIPEIITYDNEEYSVTEIDNDAFKNCIKLKSVNLPSSIIKMGNFCFKGCILLSSFSVPENLEILPSNCFNGCISLEKIELNKIKKISSFCFKGCSSIEEIKIPASVTEIGDDDVFCGCVSLKTLTFEDGSEKLKLGYYDLEHRRGLLGDSPIDSVYMGRNLSYKSYDSYSDGTSALNPFDNGNGSNNTLRSVYISNGVSELSQKLFYNCEKLEHVYGMQNISQIGDYVFHGNAIKKITIGDKVTTIGNNILSNCSALENVIIGNGIQDFTGKKILYNSNKIKNIFIGKGLKSFGANCFCSEYGGTSHNTTQSPLSNASVFLFSDEVSSNYFYDANNGMCYWGGLPRDIKVLYVVNPERYQTLFGKDYNLKPMLVFNESSLEYTGKTPELTFKNYVEGFDAAIDNSTTPKDVGSYNTNVKVELSTEGWNTTIEVPCSYTITKAPLSAIVNNVQRFYGEDNPEFACTYIGFKNGETEEVFTSKPVLTTSATTESNAGTYPIYCTGAEAKNYNITCEAGTLTINKAPQTILWEQEFNNHSIGDEIELTAKSSASLPIRYKSSDNSSVIITTKGEKQYAYILKSGITVLTAYQSGDINHEEADEVNKVISVKNVILPSSITLDKSDATINVGESFTLNANVLPDNADNKIIVWNSDDADIASVNNEGEVTGMKAGTTKIIAMTQANDLKAECLITVLQPVTGITLDRNDISFVEIGESVQLIANVLPEDASNKNVVWTSSDADVATVKNGVVVCMGYGSAVITASTEDGGYKAICVINATNGIAGVNDSKAYTEIKRYDATGREIKNPVNGLNIIKTQDGRVIKTTVRIK